MKRSCQFFELGEMIVATKSEFRMLFIHIISISENFLFFNLTVEPGPWLL